MLGVHDVPILHPFLEDAAHLWPAISGYVFWYVPGGTEFPHDVTRF